jgi:hypothetical protein
MNPQVQAALAKVQSYANTLQLKGVLVGVALGYLGHPVIKLAVDGVVLLVRGLLKI